MTYAHISTDDALDLVKYARIAVQSDFVSEWEREFCASVIARANRGAFTPSEKQLPILRRIAAKARDEIEAEMAAPQDSEVIE